MPSMTAEKLPSETPAEPVNQEQDEQLSRATIVIVDDESTTMEIVKAYLEETGYSNFVLIENSDQAMAQLEQTPPDLLLLDLIMPEVSGFEILGQIRSTPKLKHLPVIILTSSSNNQDKLKALELGATDFLAKPVDPSELRLRVRNTLAAKAYMDRLSYYDPLTQLPNRRLLMEQLNAGLVLAKRKNEKLSVLSIELDQFDKLRDTMGLMAGDNILRQITYRLTAIIQGFEIMEPMDSDHSLQGTLFHFDGGTFTLLLKSIANERDVSHVADSMLAAVRKVLCVDDTELYLTASIGIATYPSENCDSHGLLQLASSAKDHVMNKGGNSYQFSSRRIHILHKKRLMLEARLRRALERRELRVYYQPKLGVRSNRIEGFEALIRWQANRETMVPPDVFIPIAEETGLIEPIGEWVLRQACKQLRDWQQAGNADFKVAVNLSPAQFKGKSMPSVFKKIVQQQGVSPQSITFEVTENLFLNDIDEKIKVLQHLREMGFKISIDDFGTGYSSLSYLKRLPLDELKIDRSFFSDLFGDTKSRALISAMIYLARSLNLTTVAEGVEQKEQLDFLQKGACDQYQGFLFSPPLPPDRLRQLLDPTGQERRLRVPIDSLSTRHRNREDNAY